MREYVKINTMFKRDTSREGRNRIIPGDWSTPELEYLSRNTWHFTEKVDGTNIRVWFRWENDRPVVSYGGRTNDAQISAHILNHLDSVFRADDMGNLTRKWPQGEVVLYGEGYGDKVNRQGSRSYLSGTEFVLFDVEVLSNEGWLWLRRDNVENVAEGLGVPIVPLIGEGTLLDAARMTSEGINSIWGDFTAEGIVARPAVEMFTRRGQRLITKIKHKDYTDLRRFESE